MIDLNKLPNGINDLITHYMDIVYNGRGEGNGFESQVAHDQNMRAISGFLEAVLGKDFENKL